MKTRTALKYAVPLVLSALLSGTGAAQEKFPSKPIRVVVPAPPGGGTDILGRKIAAFLGQELGQAAFVENKPGAAGVVGVGDVLRNAPDGHTVGISPNFTYTVVPHMGGQSFDVSMMVPLVELGSVAYVYCVRPDFPANDAEGFLKELKSKPGKYSLGTDGVGGIAHMGSARILERVGASVVTVPFKGASDIAKDFLGGHVDIYGGSVSGIAASARDGKAKCLLLTSAADNPALPGTAGLNKVGLGAHETVLSWFAFVPKGTPASVQKVLTDQILKARASSEYVELLGKLGADPSKLSGKELEDRLKADSVAMKKLVTDLKLTAN